MRSELNEEIVEDYTKVIKIGDKAKDGAQLRPHIVWFGEQVPLFETAIEQCFTADIFVYPAASLIDYVPKNAKIFLIDPNEISTNLFRDIEVIKASAVEGMKKLYEILTK
ncbi:unnamed protein product [Cyprideis torosa]|uniref:Uncharacterized protein n=1 Tax=Cyprideis torosa TaxID=163714 RepID=A0A7R8WWY3_9CRUS|nr:unnamed protein product [Cyprideis torosa]CAG0911999.1 unnamed protein product [Cyprideis torosa]